MYRFYVPWSYQVEICLAACLFSWNNIQVGERRFDFPDAAETHGNGDGIRWWLSPTGDGPNAAMATEDLLAAADVVVDAAARSNAADPPVNASVEQGPMGPLRILERGRYMLKWIYIYI